MDKAIKDGKAAKLLQSACKAALKRGDSGKRPAPGGSDPTGSAKRARYGSDGGSLMGGPIELSPQELERSLELPMCVDEERIASTVLQTNRAPLVLAFAAELLRYTMPDQPLSSRLSLGQAVVSANSRSKAVSLGIEKGPSADDDGWGEGQPRVRIMGREVTVLRRSGYEWRGDEMIGEDNDAKEAPATTSESQATGSTQASSATLPSQRPGANWSVSQPISLKKSTFVARAAQITESGERQALVRSLMKENPKLKTASHNAWAYRLRPPAGYGSNIVREESFDDGETGCGDLMLRIMRETGCVDTIVVMSRWFGGIMLGPDRWRLMRNCVTGALSERLRKTGTEVALGGDAVWGLDLEAMRSKTVAGGHGGSSSHHVTGVVGMPIHRPEAARSYLLKSFVTAPQTAEDGSSGKVAKKTLKAQEAEKTDNLGLLLGALRIVLDSWADHLSPSDLDSRAWSWYIKVRPDVDGGIQGWGAKGALKLSDILALRRKES